MRQCTQTRILVYLQELYHIYKPESTTAAIYLEKRLLENALTDLENLPPIGSPFTPNSQKDVRISLNFSNIRCDRLILNLEIDTVVLWLVVFISKLVLI